MQHDRSTPSWRRYIALGDSFTEGLSDAHPARPGEFRGWADRLAQRLAAVSEDDVEYANRAIRGRLLRQVVEEQMPVALAAEPDLVSLVDGGNDLMRPGADPDGRTPLPPADPRPLRVAVAEEAAWVRGLVAPWIGRRLRGRSPGDGRAPKRPVPLVLPRP